jgi:hypothetical protein
MNSKEGSELVLEQIIGLLQNIDGQVYIHKLNVLNQASLGQHLRHIADFYLCLLAGADTAKIDYCQRQRDPAMEQDINIMCNILMDIKFKINDLDENKPIHVVPDYAPDEAQRQVVASSLGRELMYAFDHALHHLALVKIGLQCHFPQVPVDPNMGVAPSTIRHRNCAAS